MPGKMSSVGARKAAFAGKGAQLAAKGRAIARGRTGNIPPGLAARPGTVGKGASKTTIAAKIAQTKRAAEVRRNAPRSAPKSRRGRM